MYNSLNWNSNADSGKADQLLDEIACLERRLHSMGVDGDCAYERSISRLYQGMVEQRRRELASLCGR